MISIPTRRDLRNTDRITMIRAGTSVINADVYVYRTVDGRRILIKDIRRRPCLLRWTVGRYHLHNEYRTLRRLEKTQGVPRVYGMIDADALAMEYVAGRPLPTPEAGGESRQIPGPQWFRRLQALIGEFHRQGVAHGDLRRKNILWDETGNVVVIDFGTAVCREGPFGPFQRWFYRTLCKADDYTVLKLLHAYHSDALDPAEQERVSSPPLFLRVGRFLRHDVYRSVIKQKRWRERWLRLKQFFSDRRGAAEYQRPR